MPKNFESWMNGEDREPFDLPDGPTALIVVDMQNSYVMDDLPRPDGRSIEGFKKAVPGCERLVDAARAAGHLIVFTRYMYMEDYADKIPGAGRATSLSRREPERAYDDFANQMMPQFEPREGEILLDKSRPSSFYGTRLEPLLTARGIRNVVVCGVTTNICVETTARDAHQRGYNTFVVEDACGEFEESRHWHSLYTIAWCFGTVVTVADAERSWAKSPVLAATR
jgi:ureidoacrylate peracid hydrolase